MSKCYICDKDENELKYPKISMKNKKITMKNLINI